MNVIYSVKDYVNSVLDLHQGADSGAIAVVAVQQDDGALRCSPFHVHFGKLKLKGGRVDKQVALEVNGERVPGVRMKLGAAGEAFFMAEVQEFVEEEEYRTSPLVSPVQHTTKEVDVEELAPLDADTQGHRSEPATSSTAPKAELAPGTGNDSEVPQPEWHDTYRLERTSSTHLEDEGDRLAWGWGSLPHMRSTAMNDEVDITDHEQPEADLMLPTDHEDHAHQDEADEYDRPTMVKSESVYFDAVESDGMNSGIFGAASFGDFPSNGSLIDLDPAFESNVPYISLCGHLLGTASSFEEKLSIFAAHVVSFESFRVDPTAILASPNLIVLINGQLSALTLDVQAHLLSRILFPYSPPLPVHTSKISRASSNAAFDSPNKWSPAKSDEPQHAPVATEHVVDRMRTNSFGRSVSSTAIPSLERVDEVSSEGGASTQDTGSYTNEPYFKKSLHPSQEDLQRMNLRPGVNELSFVVTSHIDQTVVARVDAKLYLWSASAKVVIAQVDGAVSRTTTGGMFKRRDTSSPLHEGAQEFYSKLEENGYHIVYLTCHGLSQAEWIRSLLQAQPSSSAQKTNELDSSFSLPHGPVLLSPDRLLETSSNEAIDAQEFKAAALAAIRSLFPSDVNAFYAAFGKTQGDADLFTRAGVFPGKVFVVDEISGRLRHRSLLGFHESYESLVVLADTMFPPILSPLAALHHPTPANTRPSRAQTLVSETIAAQARARSLTDDAYNDVNFWRIKPGTV